MNPLVYQWAVRYRDGSVFTQFDTDGKEHKWSEVKLSEVDSFEWRPFSQKEADTINSCVKKELSASIASRDSKKSDSILSKDAYVSKGKSVVLKGDYVASRNIKHYAISVYGKLRVFRRNYVTSKGGHYVIYAMGCDNDIIAINEDGELVKLED